MPQSRQPVRTVSLRIPSAPLGGDARAAGFYGGIFEGFSDHDVHAAAITSFMTKRRTIGPASRLQNREWPIVATTSDGRALWPWCVGIHFVSSRRCRLG